MKTATRNKKAKKQEKHSSGRSKGQQRAAAKSAGASTRITALPQNPALPQSSASPQISAPPYSIEVRSGDHTILFKDITKVHPALKDQFCYCLNKVASREKSRLESKLTQELDLRLMHFAILRLLESDHSVNQNQVADELGVDKASMVKVFDFLQDKQLVERQQSPSDRRVNFLKITPQGHKALSLARKVADQEEKEFLKPLSASEAQTLRKLLLKLL